MIKKNPLLEPEYQHHDLLFGAEKEEQNFIVLVLTHDLLISDINSSGAQDFFKKDKKALLHHSIIHLLHEQKIETTEFLSAITLCSKTLFQTINIEHGLSRKKYSALIIALQENQKTRYTVTLTPVDNSYSALKSYINAIIDNLPGAVYWKDKEGYYMGCNKFVATMAGFARPEEIIGKTDYDMCWHEFAEEWRLLDSNVIKENKTIVREEKAKLANGKIITELTFKTPLKNQQGEIIGIIGTSLDITERKEMEAALRESQLAAQAASQAKTEFLENMRHDIRTPLTGIVGFSEILKRESTEPRIKEYADNLVASSLALLNLMDEVLEAVRVSSGEIPLLKKKFNLIETFTRVIDLNRAKAFEKQLTLNLDLDEKLPAYVIGDRIRLHRIALELIGNALNFTDEGHITMKISLAKKEDRELVITMVVTDTGMGIPKDKQQEIYVQFKRLTPSYQGIYKGAGLGLYVVKQFIDELGGEIYVESEPRKGTAFTCIIPLQLPLLDDATGIDHIEDLIEKPYMPPVMHALEEPQEKDNPVSSVLVVEDNLIAQTVAKTILSNMFCQVDIANNGEEAIMLFQQKHYDILFIDIGLGIEMDGYEVTRQIRNLSNKIHHTPIIALTAHGGEDNKQRCIAAGMDAVLTKPLTHEHAADMLKSFLSPIKKLSLNNRPGRRDLPDSDEEMFQLEQFAVLDIEQAMKNCGTTAVLIELLTLATQELSKDLAQMKNAFVDQNYTLVEQLAHKIKGGAVYIGTVRMKYACQYLERYWKAGQRKLFESLYFQTVDIIEETGIHIQEWLDEN